MPRMTDPYIWHYGPGQHHLFGKQLSKHNIGAYRELCREVGRSIVAVAKDPEWDDSRRAAGHGVLPGSVGETVADDCRHQMKPERPVSHVWRMSACLITDCLTC